MLGQLPEINAAMKGVGFMLGTQRPFVSFLVKNWPLTALAAYGMYARGRHRWAKNEFTSYNLLADAGLILSPLIGLAILNQIAQQDQMMRAAQATAATANQIQPQLPAPAPGA